MKVFYNFDCIYESLYASFIKIVHPDWELVDKKSYNNETENVLIIKNNFNNEVHSIFDEEFNLEEIASLENYPIFQTIQNEVSKTKGMWNWMISLVTRKNIVDDFLISDTRITEIPKTVSKLIILDNKTYWADFIIEEEPWKLNYSYLKKYPKKADILIVPCGDRYLIHSLRSEVKFEKKGKYLFHYIDHSTWTEFQFDTSKLFDFTIKKLSRNVYKTDFLKIYLIESIFDENEIKLIIKNSLITFLKNKFKSAHIIILQNQSNYLVNFNEYCDKLTSEDSLYYRIMPKQILQISKFEHPVFNQETLTYISKPKPFDEILEILKLSLINSTSYRLEKKEESDNDSE